MAGLSRPEEKKLILSAKKGDTCAMTALYETYTQELLRSAMLLLKNHDDAQDVVSQTFIIFFKTIERFDTAYPVRPWLHRILKNEALNLFQKRSRYYAAEEDIKINLPSSEPNQEDTVFTAEETRYLKEAMQQLKDDERWVLEGYYFQEMSVKELAMILKIPEGTVKSRLFNARSSLAKKIQLVMQKRE